MTVDLSKLQAGDEVELRNGATVKIWNILRGSDYAIEYCGCSYEFVYNKDGEGRNTGNGFDIIAIHPKPFNWDEVEWGQAFEDEDGVWIYIGPSKDKGELIFEHTLGHFDPACVQLSYAKKHKTRSPSHNITPEGEK